MNAPAKRGKFAEAKVRDFLKQWAADHAAFCYNRILDAHSSKGAMSTPQPGDFQWFLQTPFTFVLGDTTLHWTRNGLIEVKEIIHTTRLPFDSFGADQVGRMRIRQMAGSEPVVLLCFRPAGGKPIWRAPPFERFLVREGTAHGSWDFSDVPGHKDVASIMEGLLS